MRARCLMMLTAFFLCGCRSDADKMAEFCLNFEAIVVEASDCVRMSEALGHELDRHIVLYETNLCEKTTACLPCRKAAQKLLSECGQDASMRPVLDRMQFSKTINDLAHSESAE